MKTKKIEKLVKQAICSMLAPKKDNIHLTWEDLKLTDGLYENFNMDSLDAVELIMELEEIFDIDLTEFDELSRNLTVENIISIVKELTNDYT